MNFLTSTPKEVADYLLEHRFKNDASSTATFLLEVIDELGDVEALTAQLMEQQNDENDGSQSETKEDERKRSSLVGEPENKHITNGIVVDLGDEPVDLPLPIPSTGGESSEKSNEQGLLVSATTPRMKLNLSIYPKGIMLKSPKNESIIISPNDVQTIISFPKREDCLKAPKATKDGNHIVIPGSQILIVLKSAGSGKPITFRNKELSQICFALPQHYSREISSLMVANHNRPSAEQLTNACIDDFEEQYVDALKSSLNCTVHRVYNPKFHKATNSSASAYVFKSDDGGADKSIMQGKMPYVKCYSGVRDGVLYPMMEGLLFFKPPLFYPRSDIKSIACGRGGGGSRYVDVQLVLDDENGNDEGIEVEFTNIDREELNVLNSYIQTLVAEMQREVEDDDGEGEGDSDDASCESIIEIDGTNAATGNNSRKRPSRAASVEARKITKLHLQSTASGTLNEQANAPGNDGEIEIGDDDEDEDYETGVVEIDSDGDEEDDDEDFEEVVAMEDGEEDDDDEDDDEVSLPEHESATESEDDDE